MQRVLEMSAAAQRLVRQAQCVHYAAGRIWAIRPDDDRRLQRAIFLDRGYAGSPHGG